MIEFAVSAAAGLTSLLCVLILSSRAKAAWPKGLAAICLVVALGVVVFYPRAPHRSVDADTCGSGYMKYEC